MKSDANKAGSAIAEILAKLARSPERATARLHPLGFVHCRLYETPDDCIRLHIWPSQFRCTQEPRWLIHDHLWWLRSYIVVGEVRNEFFCTLKERARPTHQIFSVEYDEENSILYPTGRLVRAEADDESVVRAGEIYEIPTGRFHCGTAPEGRLTVTAVLTSAARDTSPQVLGAIQTVEPVAFERALCPPAQWEAILHNVMAEIAA